MHCLHVSQRTHKQNAIYTYWKNTFATSAMWHIPGKYGTMIRNNQGLQINIATATAAIWDLLHLCMWFWTCSWAKCPDHLKFYLNAPAPVSQERICQELATIERDCTRKEKQNKKRQKSLLLSCQNKEAQEVTQEEEVDMTIGFTKDVFTKC